MKDHQPEQTPSVNEEAVGPGANVVASEKHAYQLAPGIPDRVFFAYDSSVIVPEAQEAIKAQAHHLKESPEAKVTVAGHCDERGTSEYNIALGLQRANATKAALVKDGVPANSITTVSYGKSKPEVEGDTEEAYQQNRRAVIVKN